MSGDPAALALDDLRAACDKTIARLRKQYGWQDADLRLQCLHRLRNIVQSALALLAFQRSIFPTENFWRAFFDAVPESTKFSDHYRELDVMIRFAALQGMFSVFEADTRVLVRAIDPNACGGGDATFDGVIRWFLKHVNQPAAEADLVELIRLTRNTIHNNGVHRPENGKSRSLVYEGLTFSFEVGKPIEFVGWPFVALVGRGTLKFLELAVTDPVVVALKPAA